MSLVWMIGVITLDLYLDQANQKSIKCNKNRFTKITENEVHFYKGSLQDCQQKIETHRSDGYVLPHYFVDTQILLQQEKHILPLESLSDKLKNYFLGWVYYYQKLMSVISYSQQKLFIIVFQNINSMFLFCLHQDSLI